MLARRLRVDPGLFMLAVGAALIAAYVMIGLSLARQTAAGVNFLPTYSAGRSITQGRAEEMYDRSAELRAHAEILPGRPAQLAPYLNPPVAALVVAPLTRLPFATAYAVWAAVQIVLLAAGALVLVRWRRPWGDLIGAAVLCLGGVWCALDVVLGEWDGVTVLGLALCWRWRARDRPVAAGIALGLLGGIAKPHLLVGVAVYLVVRREWRLVVAAGASAVAVLVVPALVLSPHLLAGFVQAMVSSGADQFSQRFVSLSGLVYSWFGITTFSRIAGLLLSASAVAAVARLGAMRNGEPIRRDATAVCLSMLISPHLLGYDPVLLLPFLVPILAERRRRPVLLGLVLLLDAASWLDLANVRLFPPGRVTPLLLCALAGWWLWDSRRVAARPEEDEMRAAGLAA